MSMACVDCGDSIATADAKPSPRDRCIPCGAIAGTPFAEPVASPGRVCPSCGGPEEDMSFRIDETVWCLFCDWEGHEDDVGVAT